MLKTRSESYSFWGHPEDYLVNPKLMRDNVVLTCPVCKRRLLGRAYVGHDSDQVVYLIPKHKRKGWWKKNLKPLNPHRAQNPKRTYNHKEMLCLCGNKRSVYEA